MAICIGRRKFITALGGTALASALPARAQQQTMPVIGVLSAASLEEGARLAEAFRRGLSETGFVEGRNVAIEQRWAHSEFARLPDLAADLVRRQVAVIATLSSTFAAVAAKGATATIPVVFMSGGDPVRFGLVANEARPDGNVTGITYLNPELESKRFEILHDLMPNAARYAVLVDPNGPNTQNIITALQSAASVKGREIEAFPNKPDIETACLRLLDKRAGAFLVAPAQYSTASRLQLVTLAMRHKLPAVYFDRSFVEVGGLMSYGPAYVEQVRQVGIYAGRILKGEKLADLPVQRLSKFDFAINLKTANALRLIIPPMLRAQADEVID